MGTSRQETGLDQNYNDVQTIAGLVDLCSHILHKWVSELPGAIPGVMITAKAHASNLLVRRLLDGLIYHTILFEPPPIPVIAIRQIGGIELALVVLLRNSSPLLLEPEFPMRRTSIPDMA